MIDEPAAEAVEFNDPEAWGYCNLCAFQVAREVADQRRMLTHTRSIGTGSEMRRCVGSLCQPTEQPGPEAVCKAHWMAVEVVDDKDED